MAPSTRLTTEAMSAPADATSSPWLVRSWSQLDQLRAMAEAAGRDPATIALAFWANWPGDEHPIAIEDGARFIMTGNAEQIAEDIDGLGRLGVSHVLFNFQRPTCAEMLEAMQRFTEEVRPLVST